MDTGGLAEKLSERLPELAKYNPEFLRTVLTDAIGDDQFVTSQKYSETVRMHKGLAETQVEQARNSVSAINKELLNTKAEWRSRIVDGIRPMIGALKGKYRQEGAEWALRAFERVGAQQDQHWDFSNSGCREKHKEQEQ